MDALLDEILAAEEEKRRLLGPNKQMLTRFDGGDEKKIVEQHVVVTDLNGKYDSSSDSRSHEEKTNGNDAYVMVTADGTEMPLKLRLWSEAHILYY